MPPPGAVANGAVISPDPTQWGGIAPPGGVARGAYDPGDDYGHPVPVRSRWRRNFPRNPHRSRIGRSSRNDAFCGCGTAMVAAQDLDRRWIGIDISPTARRVMSERLQNICGLREGRDFCVRDLPKTAEEFRRYPPFEFENWAVNALNTVLVNGHAIPNRAKVGDKGIDGRIYPIGAARAKMHGKDLFGDVDYWLPVQVKQKDKAGRPGINLFETAMRRRGRDKGCFISFGFTADALREIERVREEIDGLEIIPLTVEEIVSEERRIRL